MSSIFYALFSCLRNTPPWACVFAACLTHAYAEIILVSKRAPLTSESENTPNVATHTASPLNASVQLIEGYSICGDVKALSDSGFTIQSQDFDTPFTIKPQDIQVIHFTNAKPSKESAFPDVITLATSPVESFTCKVTQITDSLIVCQTSFNSQITIPRTSVQGIALGKVAARSVFGTAPLVFDRTWFLDKSGRGAATELTADQQSFLTQARPVTKENTTSYNFKWALLPQCMLYKVLAYNPSDFNFSVTLAPSSGEQVLAETIFSFGDSYYMQHRGTKETEMNVQLQVNMLGIKLVRQILYSRSRQFHSGNSSNSLAFIPWADVYGISKEQKPDFRTPIHINLQASPTDNSVSYFLSVNGRLIATATSDVKATGPQTAFSITAQRIIRDTTLSNLSFTTTMPNDALAANQENTAMQNTTDILLTTDEESFSGRLVNYYRENASIIFEPKDGPSMQVPLSFISSLQFGNTSTGKPIPSSSPYSIFSADSNTILAGNIVQLNEHTCTLQHELLGEVTIPRGQIRQIKKHSHTAVKKSTP